MDAQSLKSSGEAANQSNMPGYIKFNLAGA